MAVALSAETVWNELGKHLFAVIGMVTARGEARTVGVLYLARDRRIYIGTGKDTWKARHITANPHVSVTVPIARRIPIAPWIEIPAATITFSGPAVVRALGEVDPEVVRGLFRGMEGEATSGGELCIIAIEPRGEFLTYGIGVSLMTMRHPDQARGRAPVGV
jgi:hypothetical protein